MLEQVPKILKDAAKFLRENGLGTEGVIPPDDAFLKLSPMCFLDGVHVA